MPLYDCKCPNCGEIEDIWARINEINPKCPRCSREMERLISPTRIICDIEPYFDDNLADSKTSPQGQWVKSRQHKRQLLKEQNLREIG